MASDGNMYGMASLGGSNSDGVVFKCDTKGNISTLLNFNGRNGANPFYGKLLQASDGNLYGLTGSGGAYNNGVIFSISQSAGSAVYSFQTATGTDPSGSLIKTTDGTFYGMTQAGGAFNQGVIFKFTLSGGYDTLMSFNGVNGSTPYGSLVMANDGNMYGMTYAGGKFSDGNIFRLSVAGQFDTVASFNDNNGADPLGSLIQASDGNLYGMTNSGGPFNQGVVFKCTLGGTLDTLMSFNGNNGSYPKGDLLEVNLTEGIASIPHSGGNISVYPNPASNILNLKLNGIPNSTEKITITDVTGKTFITSTTHVAGNNNIQVNISGLSTSIYFINVISGSATQIEKFVKE